MDKQQALDAIWSAYKQAHTKDLPKRRPGRKREDIDNYQYEKVMKSKFGRWT